MYKEMRQMPEQITPIAPDSLPKYIAEGIPKQDIDTLEDLREYVDEMIEHKRRPVSESEIPDEAAPVEDDTSGKKGTIYIRKNTCGDETCHCANGGDLHGPYKYRVFRDERGKVVHDYQGPANEG